MKYIKTKDGIVEIVKELSYCYLDKNGNEYLLDKHKTSDTIEELCDEFVGIHKAFKKPRILYDGTLKDICDDVWNYEEIYGAIWTDKGLIYVAKINEKGELELL